MARRAAETVATAFGPPNLLNFKDTPEVAKWLAGPFFKAVCQVKAKEFANAKAVDDHVVLTESALANREVAIAFRPRDNWPKMFRYLRLYREPPPTPPSDGAAS